MCHGHGTSEARSARAPAWASHLVRLKLAQLGWTLLDQDANMTAMDHEPQLLRVAMVLGRDGQGGSESQTGALVRGLRAAGVSVDCFIVEGDGAGGPCSLPEAHVLIARRRAGLAGLWSMVVGLARLRSILNAGEYDVVHGVMSRAYVLVPLAGRLVRKRPLVVSWRRNLGVHLAPRSAAAALERLASKLTDVIISNSDAVREYWVQRGHGHSDTSIVIPNIVEDWRFIPKRAVDKKAGTTRLLSVGGLKPVKGFDVLIEAAAKLAGDGREVEVVILGDGECREDLIDRAEQAGVSLLLPGHVSDPRPWLASADIYVQPSRSEGLSNATIEAMAQGLPIVATSVGGLTALLKDVGVIVPVEDSAAISAHLVDLLDNPGQAVEMGRAAQRRARALFGSVEVVDRHIAAYTSQRLSS